MHCRFSCCVIAIGIMVPLFGCQDLVREALPSRTSHERFGWHAEDYFHDPQVIALCQAIEADNLPEIDRLIAAGANVNCLGKDNMTPLLWSFFDNKLDRFKRLLELGADPNVIVKGDFAVRSMATPGDSVTHMACATTFPGYFDEVFKHGGNADLEKEGLIGNGETPLFSLIMSPAHNKREKMQVLLSQGANPNHVDATGATPAMAAVGWFRQFDLALLLLESGADASICKSKSNSRLVHFVHSATEGPSGFSPQQKANCALLVQWLEQHDESMDQAMQDRRRWKTWSDLNGEYRRKMANEVAARKELEPRLNPADYFDDQKVIALCQAIAKNDLADIDRLIMSGANVNALGKGQVTPLLWAFPPTWIVSDPPGKLDTFKHLLARGANPNVEFKPDSKMRIEGALIPDSVTHLAARSEFPGYFEAVFANGGDVNFVKTAWGSDDAPLFSVIEGNANDKARRIKLLIEMGADLNHLNPLKNTPAMAALSWGKQFELVLPLLEAGAKYDVDYPKSNKRLVHAIIELEPSLKPHQKQACTKVVNWLDSHGESVQQARIDLNRWKQRP